MKKQQRFRLDRARQIAPQIVEYLREQILALELEPGAPLSRGQLQEQFGLSQTPVRDALMRLAEEGLVTVYPQYATLVSKINIQLARQTHMMRRAIEQEAVYMLAERSGSSAGARLRSANERMKKIAAADAPGEFLLLDREFHRIIFEEAGVEDIWPIIRRHSGHLDRLRRLNLPHVGEAKVVAWHDEIIAGIEAGDPQRAEAAMKAHLSETLARVDEIVALHPDFMDSTAPLSYEH